MREAFARLATYYPGGLRESKQSSYYDYFAFEGTSVNFYYDASGKITVRKLTARKDNPDSLADAIDSLERYR